MGSSLMLTRRVADGILGVSDQVWRCVGQAVDFWLCVTTRSILDGLVWFLVGIVEVTDSESDSTGFV